MNAPVKPPAKCGAHVYTAIAAAMAEIAKRGISKDRKNDQQGYKFRGIDDVYNALAPILADQQLCIVPNVLTREVVERQTMKGGALFYVTCQVEFAIISGVDGSAVRAVTFGEAMDSGDKATNKAMSAAYKYMAMQTFCIPTEGDNDPDAATHEVAAKPAETPKPKSSYAAKQDGTDHRFKVVLEELYSLATTADVNAFIKARADEIQGWPGAWRKVMREKLEEQKRLIANPPDDFGLNGDNIPQFN